MKPPRFSALIMLVSISGCAQDGGGQGSGPPPPSKSSSSSGAASSPLPVAKNYPERSALFMYSCMRDRGWSQKLNADFTVEGSVPPDQQGAYTKDSNECSRQFTEKEPPQPVTADLAKKLYALELKTAACLESQGVHQTQEPISEQQFVDELLSGQPPSWNAYMVLNDSPAAFKAHEKKCPQPGDVLVQP